MTRTTRCCATWNATRCVPAWSGGRRRGAGAVWERKGDAALFRLRDRRKDLRRARAIVDDDVRPGSSEFECAALADASCRSGDEHFLAMKLHGRQRTPAHAVWQRATVTAERTLFRGKKSCVP